MEAPAKKNSLKKKKKKNQDLGLHEKVVKKTEQPNNSQTFCLHLTHVRKIHSLPPSFLGYVTSSKKNKKQINSNR